MGIFDIDSGADNHLLNEQFHVFSKSPASVNTSLGVASNRSGHTVTSSDVWGQEIPAFFAADDMTIANTYNAKKNDLCRIGNSVAIFKDGAWSIEYASYTDIPDGHVFLNANDEPVVRFHKNRVAHLLNLKNNANDDGQQMTAKIQGWDTENKKPYDYVETAPKFVSQFVTSTDKIIDGVPSKGYGPFVIDGTKSTTGDITKVLNEGTVDSEHYVANSFAGIIQYNRKRSEATYVHAFEYCGKTLSTAVSDIKQHGDDISTIKASLGLEETPGTTSLGGRVSDNETALRILIGLESDDKVVASESITATANNAAKAAVEGVNVTSTGSNGVVASQVKSVVSLEVTPATVSDAGVITENADNVVTASDAKAIADKAASDAITTALAEGSAITEKIESEIAEATLEGEISDNDTSTKLVTAEQVVTYVSENAKVTLTADTNEGKTGITINPNASESTSFTIGIDQAVIATTDYVDDAIDALSATDGVITNLTTTVNTAQQNAAASEAAAKAAQAAAEAAQAAAEAAEDEATAAKSEATTAKSEATTAKEAASQSAADSAQSAADSAQSAANAAASAQSATASQAAAEKAADDAEAAAADATSAKATVEGFESTLNAASLNATDTLEDMFTITTEGTVKGGFTKFEITDIGLGTAINTAKTSAVTEVLGTNITSVTGKDDETSPKVTVQLSGTVQTPSLTVTTSDIASAASLKTLTETVNTHIENAAGLYLSVEKVETLPETGMETNKIYLVPVDTEEGREKNIHTEYIWTGTTWEIIGTTAIDINSLEEAISGVSQVVADTQSQLTEFVGTTYANDKKTLEDSIEAISDKVGETDVAAQITGAINALGIGTGKVEASNEYTVTGGTVYTAVNAATTAANNAKTSADKKLASIGNDGDARVIIGTPTADGDTKSVTIKLATTVATTTDGTAYSKTETDAAIKVAKDAADSKIATVEVATDAATHLGAHHISATTDTDKNVTIAVSCSDEWEYTGAALTGVTSVINGKMSDGSDGKTIDDANLTSAEGMFQNNVTLTTYVGSLGKLTNGKNMFNGCEGLTTFVADLTSLTDGTGMFAGCDLTEESLMYIVDSLPPVVGEQKTITVDVAESVTNKEVYKAEALTKGWNLV